MAFYIDWPAEPDIDDIRDRELDRDEPVRVIEPLCPCSKLSLEEKLVASIAVAQHRKAGAAC